MKTASLKPGTTVKVNKLGRVFEARITGRPAGGQVPIEPLGRNITYYHVRPHQIVEIVPEPAQLQLGAAQ